MKNRLIWVAAILLAAVLYLFENNAGTLTGLVGVLAVPILGLAALIGKKLRLEIHTNTAQEKGQTGRGRLYVENPGWMILPRLELTVSCSNLRTGERASRVLDVSLLPKQKKTVDFEFDCLHCGVVELKVTDVCSMDLFGLFVRKLDYEAGADLTVLPQLFEPSVSLESHDMAMPDSDTYSPTKPGSDPGETFNLREYVLGDAIRKIHWKLSEKTDKLMVREFGLPVVNEVALLLETAGAETPDETDAITEVFASVSAALIGADIAHHVFWRDGQTDELREYSITTEDDFSFMLEELMELPPRAEGSVSRRFMESHPHCPYAHVIIVGGQIPIGTRDLYNGNRVSILLSHRNSIVEGLQPDGTHVLSFGVEDYAMDLCRLEV